MHSLQFRNIYGTFLFQNKTPEKRTIPASDDIEPQPSTSSGRPKRAAASAAKRKMGDRSIVTELDEFLSDADISVDDYDSDESFVQDFMGLNVEAEEGNERSHHFFNITGEIDEEDDEEGDVVQNVQPSENETLYKARSGHLWTNLPLPTSRTRARNLFREVAGLRGAAQDASTREECFDAYMTNDILQKIVLYTNKFAAEYIIQKNATDKKLYRDTDILELRAFLGILITMGINNDTKQDLERLWDDANGRPIYSAGMSKRRFKALLVLIRFDDRAARIQREAAGEPNPNKLEPLQEVFDMFNRNLRANYNPGMNLCIDEMLCLFRGNAPFRVYMKSKPGKYGLLLRMLSDVKTKLVIQTAPYGGPIGDTPSKKPQQIVMDLVSPYFNSNRNITTDRYYTSIPLATELFSKNITLVGTVNNCRVHLPEELKVAKGRELHSTMFAMSKMPVSGPNVPIMLASYMTKVKPPRNVILLSTVHPDFKIRDEYKDKPNTKKIPEVIEFYNDTMGTVDTDDQMVRRFSCKRATRRWPLSWFFSIIDICALNAYIIHGMKNIKIMEDLKKRKHGVRINFYDALTKELILPHARRRLQTGKVSHKIRGIIKECYPQLKEPELQAPVQIQRTPDMRKRCVVCYTMCNLPKKK